MYGYRVFILKIIIFNQVKIVTTEYFLLIKSLVSLISLNIKHTYCKVWKLVTFISYRFMFSFQSLTVTFSLKIHLKSLFLKFS